MVEANENIKQSAPSFVCTLPKYEFGDSWRRDGTGTSGGVQNVPFYNEQYQNLVRDLERGQEYDNDAEATVKMVVCFVLMYEFFGDVVVFDSGYTSNRHGMPFTGVDHHYQTIFFGVLETWLEAMNYRKPMTIVYISRLSIGEFEERWKVLVRDYELDDSNWHHNLYNDAREKWISPFTKTFMNDAPFNVNIYPFLSLYGNDNFPIDYAFFDGSSTNIVDNGIAHNNVFDANAGYGDMPIVVREVGWPTDGDKNANINYAYRFYNGLLPRLAANKGTPLLPGYIEVYLFGLIDEDAKSIQPGNFERHWGIFRYEGQPKFGMDLSGQGQNNTQNVQYQTQKWCTFNPNAKDMSKFAENIDYACTFADCTPLGYGSSCNGLDTNGNASYAFNAYFQVQNQGDLSCNVQGLAMVTTQNISQGECNFSIQIATSSWSSSAIPSLFAIVILAAFTILIL